MSVFEEIKHVTEYGAEYWYARELMPHLGYDTWRSFENVIEKAKISCETSGLQVGEEFLPTPAKTLDIGGRPTSDYILSRQACYLIAQNGHPSKIQISLAQNYFATQTRKLELQEQLIEDQRRVMLRDEMKTHNIRLASAAKDAGVVEPVDYAIFQNFGYSGLYSGLDTKGIHKKKKLTSSQKILDHMGSEELAANLFRATQAEAKLRREGIKGKKEANSAHFEVGKTVRDTIKRLGGTMLEDLPAVDGIGKAQRRLKKTEEKKNDIIDDNF